jgi:hypothetical protein
MDQPATSTVTGVLYALTRTTIANGAKTHKILGIFHTRAQTTAAAEVQKRQLRTALLAGVTEVWSVDGGFEMISPGVKHLVDIVEVSYYT